MSGTAYRAAEVIRLLRVQKHDFLNHLQVISGFLQLNKADRALDYTRETIKTISAQGTVLSLGSTDLALCLLLQGQRAAERQVAVSLEVTPAEVQEQAIPYTAVGVVEAAWEIITGALEQIPVTKRFIRVRVMESTEYYTIHFYTPLGSDAVAAASENLQQLTSRSGGHSVFCGACPRDDGWELVFRIPKAVPVHRELGNGGG